MKQAVQLNTIENKRRLEYIDIAKGIGVLLVVWSHAMGPYKDYLYQFHMPLFFLISGYLYSSHDIPWKYIQKKVKSLYIPFAFWNVFFILIRPFFGIYDYRGRILYIKIRNILLTFDKDGDFLGATWFLGALFVVSVFYKLMDYYLPEVKGKSIFLTVLFGIIALTGFQITLPFMFSRTCILAFFFAIGRTVKEFREWLADYDTVAFFFFSVIVFLVIGHYNGANMGANTYRYPALFVVGAILASYAVIYVSKILEKRTVYLKKIFALMGKKSISIVIWHLVVFRLVIALQLLLWNQPLTEIGNYYPSFVTTGGWWIVFIIVGIIGSMIIGEIISAIKRGITWVFKRS